MSDAIADNTVNTRHSLTGKLQRLTPGQIEPFKDYLEIVPDDAKPYEPGLFKPGKVGEFQNPDLPQTDAVADAQAALEIALADNAPNSRVVKSAKEHLENVQAQAEADKAAAEAEAKAIAEADKSGDAAQNQGDQ